MNKAVVFGNLHLKLFTIRKLQNHGRLQCNASLSVQGVIRDHAIGSHSDHFEQLVLPHHPHKCVWAALNSERQKVFSRLKGSK